MGQPDSMAQLIVIRSETRKALTVLLTFKQQDSKEWGGKSPESREKTNRIFFLNQGKLFVPDISDIIEINLICKT